MNKRERTQVVELLRCGADFKSNLVFAGYGLGWCDGIWPCSKIYSLACKAYTRINRIPSEWYWVRRDLVRRACLEAAQQVEEGWQP